MPIFGVICIGLVVTVLLLHVGVAAEEMGPSTFVLEADASCARVAEDCGLAAAASSSLKLLPEHVVVVCCWPLLDVDWLEAFFLSWSGVEVLGSFPSKRLLSSEFGC